MPVFATSQDLRDVFGGFLHAVAAGDLKGFSGSGMVLAYTVSEPNARFVLDAREPAKPGAGFKVFVDDPKAPDASVDVIVTGDVLDRMYGGELNVMAALGKGLIKSKGDQLSAVRLLPVMYRLVPMYKSFRTNYFAAAAAKTSP